MSTSPLEQDFTSNNNSSRFDQKPPAPNYSSTSQLNASSFDFMNKVPQSTFERGSLKNLSNDELEKLIQQKTQSIEKIQATNTNLSSSMTRTTGLSLASPSRKVGNQNVNQILSKYNLTPGNEDKGSYEYRPVENKTNESHIAQTTDPASGGDTPGFPSAFLHSGDFDPHKKEVLRETNLAINTTENPYLSNLESSIERIEQPQTRTSKDIDVFLFNQEFGTSRDYQLGSPVMGNSPLRLSGKPQSKENVPKAFNLGQMTPKQSTLPKPAKGSPAIAGAMKALQDKLENAEAEINELKKKLNDAGNEKHRELEEQKKKIFRELESREQREDELLKKVENLNTQNFQLQNELTRIKLTNQTNEEQLQSVKAELIKLKDETRNLQQENGVIKKEVMLVENEKNFHIEQNANDRDSYERRIEELSAELDEEREKRAQLEKYKEEAETFRAEAEDELHRITNELSSLGKHNKEKIKTLEHQLDEALKQNQAYVEEFSTAMGKSEKEKISLQKKVDDFDRRIEAIVTSYEDKIDAYKEENNDFKKLTNSQQKELVSLKKRVVQLDQENAKLESYKGEKDKVIKQLLEIADDLARKIKKDPNDTILQNILFKKKKIEQEVQSKNRERSAAKKKTPGSGKKSYSRSPSAKKSARKEALSVEDLNLSRDSGTGVTPRSSNRKRKMSGSQGHRMPSQPSPLRDSKMSIPLKGSVGHDNPPKPQRSASNTGRTQSKRDKPSPKRKDSLTKNTPLNIRTYTTEDPVTSYNFVGILGVPSTAPNEAGKKLLGSVSSNEMSYASKLESSNLQSNRPVKLNFDIEKMSSNQISAEIVKIEREISELKREYKNLLAKAQNTEAGDVQEVKDRLTQVANELQEKSEAHLLIKKKQRELLSKNM